jgi:ssDNA thymidine ADP-ribosyltransferase, DarT
MTAPADIPIYHITDIANLRGIVAGGGLRSDVAMAQFNPEVIGYDHIKKRRATEIRVGCCGNRFVGEFVPFYYCPRSPMLFSINKGNTGRPAGCQRSIVHLVSKVGLALNGAADWAISDGNAGAYHSLFYKDLKELGGLDWQAIRATQWQGQTHQKMAEFLVADFFPWNAFEKIGCQNAETARQVTEILDGTGHRPVVSVEHPWYY